MRTIDSQLEEASLAGDVDLALLLLARGADVNSRNSIGCTPLMHAAYKGHLACVKMLLENGADRDLAGDNGYKAIDWAEEPNIRKLLKEWSPENRQSELAQKKDQVVFISEISNRTLEEVFNFASRERISLVRQSVSGPVEAITREDFSDIKNQEALQKAFEQYKKLGGKLSEADVFPDRIFKAKMPRLGSQKP